MDSPKNEASGETDRDREIRRRVLEEAARACAALAAPWHTEHRWAATACIRVIRDLIDKPTP